MIRIVSLVGKPGAGKSTLAQYLEIYHGWKRISTGEILRQEALKDTENGRFIKKILDAGEYAPTNLMLKIIAEHLENLYSTDKYEQTVILDGFPRTKDQCGAIEFMVRKYNLPVSLFIVVRLAGLSDEDLYNRVSRRLVCSNPNCGKVYANTGVIEKCQCGNELVLREDDSFELFSKRMGIFKCYEDQIIAYYKHFGRLYEINASKSTALQAAEIRFILWTADADPMCRDFSDKFEN